MQKTAPWGSLGVAREHDRRGARLSETECIEH
jgi:hypothetical protein